jgi:hypothetical protein
MAPLTDLVSEDGFKWHPVPEEALTLIKRLASKIPLLKPISYFSGEQIFLFTNICKLGAGVRENKNLHLKMLYKHPSIARNLP